MKILIVIFVSLTTKKAIVAHKRDARASRGDTGEHHVHLAVYRARSPSHGQVLQLRLSAAHARPPARAHGRVPHAPLVVLHARAAVHRTCVRPRPGATLRPQSAVVLILLRLHHVFCPRTKRLGIHIFDGQQQQQRKQVGAWQLQRRQPQRQRERRTLLVPGRRAVRSRLLRTTCKHYNYEIKEKKKQMNIFIAIRDAFSITSFRIIRFTSNLDKSVIFHTLNNTHIFV